MNSRELFSNKNPDGTPGHNISIKLPDVILVTLERIVSDGLVANRSEFCRIAIIEKLFAEYQQYKIILKDVKC